METQFPQPDLVQEIDASLASWRQGDVAFEEKWFLHAADSRRPLTVESAQVGGGGGPTMIESEVEGLVVVTQTCDIVRSCSERPFVEMVPLVSVSPEDLQGIQRGRRPAYAFIPAVAGRHLVADLDRVMTIEKALLASWTRTPGWDTDLQARQIAQALGRKRVRFAFPDDFTNFARRLQGRLQEKHNKQTAEGDALRALREIRVKAVPSWDAAEVELTFWFILDEGRISPGVQGLEVHRDAWLELVPPSGRFKDREGFVVELGDMTAQDYVESDRLDLDHLSLR